MVWILSKRKDKLKDLPEDIKAILDSEVDEVDSLDEVEVELDSSTVLLESCDATSVGS